MSAPRRSPPPPGVGSYEIVEFGATAPATDLAELHTELLPSSPVARLGQSFLERFYYRALPAEGALFGAVAYVDGRPAGFQVAAPEPGRLLSLALRRHRSVMARVAAGAVLRSPRRASAAWDTITIARSRSGDGFEAAAELVSGGVRPEYRRSRLGHGAPWVFRDVVEAALRRCPGDRPVFTLVDETNVPSQRFFRGHGWEPRGVVTAGWPVPQTRLVVERPGDHGRSAGPPQGRQGEA